MNVGDLLQLHANILYTRDVEDILAEEKRASEEHITDLVTAGLIIPLACTSPTPTSISQTSSPQARVHLQPPYSCLAHDLKRIKISHPSTFPTLMIILG